MAAITQAVFLPVVKAEGAATNVFFATLISSRIKLMFPVRLRRLNMIQTEPAGSPGFIFADGEKRYILAPQDLKVGDVIITAERASLKPGNRMKLKNIPQGSLVHNIEMHPNKGGTLARSAGSAASVLASENKYVQLVMPSSETRLISEECFASIGQLSNAEHNSVSLGKAGRTRWLGRRPKVRGTAMNPVDHPYGGGEGRQGRGTRRPKTAQGKITGGRKTRNIKRNQINSLLDDDKNNQQPTTNNNSEVVSRRLSVVS